jgi:hypothetical protein
MRARFIGSNATNFRANICAHPATSQTVHPKVTKGGEAAEYHVQASVCGDDKMGLFGDSFLAWQKPRLSCRDFFADFGVCLVR